MKKMLIMALLLTSQILFSAPGEPVRRLSPSQAREVVQNSPTFKKIEEMRKQGKDIMADPQIRDRLTRVLELNLRGVTTLSASHNNNMIKLLSINTLDVMSEVARLSSIAKDPTSSAAEKQMSSKALELMAKSAHSVQALARNSAEGQKQQAQVKKIIEISNKISSLNFGEASKTFIEKYEKALTEGKSLEEAIRIASNGKFSEKELRECE
jgi:hypothetical protein